MLLIFSAILYCQEEKYIEKYNPIKFSSKNKYILNEEISSIREE